MRVRIGAVTEKGQSQVRSNMEQERYYDPLDRDMLEEFNKKADRLNEEERNSKIRELNSMAPLHPKAINMKSDLMITDFLTGRK